MSTRVIAILALIFSVISCLFLLFIIFDGNTKFEIKSDVLIGETKEIETKEIETKEIETKDSEAKESEAKELLNNKNPKDMGLILIKSKRVKYISWYLFSLWVESKNRKPYSSDVSLNQFGYLVGSLSSDVMWETPSQMNDNFSNPICFIVRSGDKPCWSLDYLDMTKAPVDHKDFDINPINQEAFLFEDCFKYNERCHIFY